MVFSSPIFVYWLLPVALALYFLAPRRLKHLSLTVTSYVFYGWANPYFVILMFATTLVDWLAALTIAHGGRLRRGEPPQLELGGARSRAQRLALVASVVSNLGSLAFFKYFNFGVDAYNDLVSLAGLDSWAWHDAIRIALPLGISFYTFQSLSYTIDVYRGNVRALRSLVDFACFVAMFPQLVAGPIERFSELEAQLRHRTHTLDKAARGVALFALGMGKKVLLANPCGQIADATFAAAAPPPTEAWTGLLAYGFQIYFDFSGYTDMAIGLGLVLGFTYAKNFDSPYRSASIAEFWRRWHISLSMWLRDFLYVPLGGNRKGRRRTYVNLLVVMVLGGLWHGAAWTFLAWGALHGALLAIERWGGEQGWRVPGPRPVRVGLTFLLVLLGWVLFRARDMAHAADYYRALFGLLPLTEASAIVTGVVRGPFELAVLGLAAIVVWFGTQAWDYTQRLPPIRAGVCAAVLAAALVAMASQGENPFLYFIF